MGHCATDAVNRPRRGTVLHASYPGSCWSSGPCPREPRLVEGSRQRCRRHTAVTPLAPVGVRVPLHLEVLSRSPQHEPELDPWDRTWPSSSLLPSRRDFPLRTLFAFLATLLTAWATCGELGNHCCALLSHCLFLSGRSPDRK